MFQSIEKRSGELVFFDQGKITNAILKALVYTKSQQSSTKLKALAEVASDKVVDRLVEVYGKRSEVIPSVEHIQDIVENVLMTLGEHDTARNYIKYRYEHKRRREEIRSAANILELFQNEDVGDLRPLSKVHETLIEVASMHYWRKECMDEITLDYEMAGLLKFKGINRIAPKSMCINLPDILLSGVSSIEGFSLAPAKHLDTALMQLVSLIGILKHEVSRTLLIHHLDTYLCPYIRADELSFNQIKQKLQSFVAQLAYVLLPSSSPVGVTLVFDKHIPEGISEEQVILEGKRQIFELYAGYQYELDLFNLAFAEVLEENSACKFELSRIQTVYQVGSKWDWHDPVSDHLVALGLKTGRIGFSAESNTVWQQCIGTTSSVTVQLEILAKECHHLNEFFEKLDEVLDAAAGTLVAQSNILVKSYDLGMYPVTLAHLGRRGAVKNPIDDFVLEIAVGGFDRCIHSLTGGQENLSTSVGIAFAEEITEWIEERMLSYQRVYQKKFRLDQSETLKLGQVAALDELVEHYHDFSKHFKGDTAIKAQIPQSVAGLSEVKSLLKKALGYGGIPRFTFQ